MISTRGRYALRVMINLAHKKPSEFASLKSIVNEEEISEKYMESIISLLVKAGYVEGVRGKGGGYRLVKPAENYTVGDILRVTEGTLSPVACIRDEPNECARSESCKTLPLWKGLNKVINEYLDGITLKDLI